MSTTAQAVPEEFWGPVDYLIAEVAAGTTAERGIAELLTLVDAHQIRVLDVEVFFASDDGVSEVPETEWENVLGTAARDLVGARSGLLDTEDRLAIADGLAEGSAALVVVYESLITMAAVAAFAKDGVRVLDGGPLGPDEIAAALAEVGEEEER